MENYYYYIYIYIYACVVFNNLYVVNLKIIHIDITATKFHLAIRYASNMD